MVKRKAVAVKSKVAKVCCIDIYDLDEAGDVRAKGKFQS